MNKDQAKISIYLLAALAIFTMLVSVGNERDIQKLTEENARLKSCYDSLRVEYYATNIEWGLYHVKFR